MFNDIKPIDSLINKEMIGCLENCPVPLAKGRTTMTICSLFKLATLKGHSETPYVGLYFPPSLNTGASHEYK